LYEGWAMIKKYRINNLTFWAFEKDGALFPAEDLLHAIRGVESTHQSLLVFAELLFGGHVEEVSRRVKRTTTMETEEGITK
jgi:hypothetical protein